MAESNRPLIFRLPWGATSLYNCTSVFVFGDTVCTLDQSGMCLAAQDGRMDRNNRSTSPLSVVFLKKPPLFLVGVFMVSLTLTAGPLFVCNGPGPLSKEFLLFERKT